jgi:hypothetical protein
LVDSYKGEKWEKVIEYELNFYANIQEYEDRLLEQLYESQVIHYPVTTFDEDLGRVYRSCPGTEDQALYRIEVRESIEALLKRAVKRINRLNNALAQLKEDELDIISIYYFEKGLSDLRKARTLGFGTVKQFTDKKEKILKKLFSIYEKERAATHKEFYKNLKDELHRKAALFKGTKFSSKNQTIKQSV